MNIPSPTMLRSIQPFLGSLNYYSRFIEVFSIDASVLFELREADFFKINRVDDRDTMVGDRYHSPFEVGNHDLTLRGGDRDLNGKTR